MFADASRFRAFYSIWTHNLDSDWDFYHPQVAKPMFDHAVLLISCTHIGHSVKYHWRMVCIHSADGPQTLRG